MTGYDIDHTVILSDRNGLGRGGRSVRCAYRTYRDSDGIERQPITTYFATILSGFDGIPSDIRGRVVLAWRRGAYVDVMDETGTALDCFNVYDYEADTVTFLPTTSEHASVAAEAFARWVLALTDEDEERIRDIFRWEEA